MKPFSPIFPSFVSFFGHLQVFKQSVLVFSPLTEVCYLRLDFETFTLLGTGGSSNQDEGVCLDTFTVSVFDIQKLEKKYLF